MPAKYEAIKDKLKQKGLSDEEAKKHAAMIFNSQRKPGTPPVTRGYDKKK